MIKNERQYLITKGQAKKFKEAIAAFDNETTDTHPLLAKAQREALESQLAELKLQMDEYEKLRSGKIKRLKQSSFQNLPVELIRARIARGLTQKDLAGRNYPMLKLENYRPTWGIPVRSSQRDVAEGSGEKERLEKPQYRLPAAPGGIYWIIGDIIHIAGRSVLLMVLCPLITQNGGKPLTMKKPAP